ncbi:uncharacterized protein [Solanum lycopersicum]|uniref:uncharacterized protein n=1 Tax=Solanum lycopersicum TaxID=4081 RepID=UPI0037494497
MAAPLNLEESPSSTKPPRFNRHFYSWWKVRMHDFLMDEDSEIWDIVLDGSFIPMIEEKDGERTRLAPKPRQKYDKADRKRIQACESAKEIWDCLKTTHEGTEQVKESKIDMFTSLYENFKMKEGETIHEMFTKLSSITNELRSIGEPISMSKQVRKVFRILPKSWESKVDSISEAKDIKVLTMDALIGNLKTHEMNRNHDLSKKEFKKDKSLMLKYKSDENKGFRRGTNGSRNATQNDTCYKCVKAGHFIRECPVLKTESREYQKPRSDKEKRRDLVLDKNDRKATADYVVKKALAAWGDSSKNEEEDDKVTLLDMKHDLNNYSLEKLRTLANVMIDSVFELTSERDIMNAELDSLTENKVKLEEKMSKMVSLESDNTELKKQLNQIMKKLKS